MENQHNKGRIEGFMQDLGRKLDQLMDRARQGAEEARLNEKMEELKQTKEKLEHELHEFVQDDEKWKEVQSHLQDAALEIKKAFETTFRGRKGSSTEGAPSASSSSSNTDTGNTAFNEETNSHQP